MGKTGEKRQYCLHLSVSSQEIGPDINVKVCIFSVSPVDIVTLIIIMVVTYDVM